MNDQPQKLSRFRPTGAQRFPARPLSVALEQARALYKIAHDTAVPIPVAAKCWGFGAKSSGGAQAVACLKSFGLLQDAGSGDARRVKLTEEAIKIIRDPRDISLERDDLIRAAALKPPLHRAIIAHFGGRLPPSDEVLKTYLIFDVGMRDEAVSDCMRVFAESMAFAKIGSSDTMPEVAADNSGNGGSPPGRPVEEVKAVEQPAIPPRATITSPAVTNPGMERASFPLKGGIATVEMPAQLSEEDFEDFEAWMQLVLRKARRTIRQN